MDIKQIDLEWSAVTKNCLIVRVDNLAYGVNRARLYHAINGKIAFIGQEMPFSDNRSDSFRRGLGIALEIARQNKHLLRK